MSGTTRRRRAFAVLSNLWRSRFTLVAEDRADAPQDLPYPQRSTRGCLRLHRALPQSGTTPLEVGLSRPHGVGGPRYATLTQCLRNRQQATTSISGFVVCIHASQEPAGAPCRTFQRATASLSSIGCCARSRRTRANSAPSTSSGATSFREAGRGSAMSSPMRSPSPHATARDSSSACAFPGNPYDGDTLGEALEQLEVLTDTRRPPSSAAIAATVSKPPASSSPAGAVG